MDTDSKKILASSFAGAFLVVGIPYWQIPYAQVSLPDAVWNAGLIVVGGLAALVRILGAARLRSATLLIGASVPAAVMARVLYDTWSDPTSHNLWPFEIVLAAAPGLAAAFIGALVGGLLARRGGA